MSKEAEPAGQAHSGGPGSRENVGMKIGEMEDRQRPLFPHLSPQLGLYFLVKIEPMYRINIALSWSFLPDIIQGGIAAFFCCC